MGKAAAMEASAARKKVEKMEAAADQKAKAAAAAQQIAEEAAVAEKEAEKEAAQAAKHAVSPFLAKTSHNAMDVPVAILAGMFVGVGAFVALALLSASQLASDASKEPLLYENLQRSFQS